MWYLLEQRWSHLSTVVDLEAHALVFLLYAIQPILTIIANLWIIFDSVYQLIAIFFSLLRWLLVMFVETLLKLANVASAPLLTLYV